MHKINWFLELSFSHKTWNTKQVGLKVSFEKQIKFVKKPIKLHKKRKNLEMVWSHFRCFQRLLQLDLHKIWIVQMVVIYWQI